MGSQAGYSNRDAGICSWVASLASPGHSAETQEAFNLKKDQGSKSYDEPRQRWIIEKAEKPDQIANIPWIIEKAKKFQKNIYLCFIDYTKSFDCVDHNKWWKTLKSDRNIRPPDLPPEKPVCKSNSNS